jgi:hypothetical protein
MEEKQTTHLNSNLQEIQINLQEKTQKVIQQIHEEFAQEIESEQIKEDIYHQSLEEKKGTLNQKILKLSQEHQILKDKNEFLQHNNKILETQVEKYQEEFQSDYQSGLIISFLDLDIYDLEIIHLYTSSLDLFYAVSYRLALIEITKENYYQAFIYLCCCPKNILKWYQVEDIDLKLQTILIKLHPGIIHPDRFIDLALETEDTLVYEALLLLAGQLGPSNKRNPYVLLLEYYINQEAWLNVHLMIEKIRIDDQKNRSNILPSDFILKKMSDFFNHYRTEKDPNHLFKLHQLSSGIFYQDNIKKIGSYPISLLLNEMRQLPNINQFFTTLSLINHQIYHEVPECFSFLNHWMQYKQGLEHLKLKNTEKAQHCFEQLLKINPFFLEAKLKLESISSQFNWPKIFTGEESCYSTTLKK